MPDAVKKLGKSEGIWWMDPADPRVQQQSLDVIADVLDRYDVDGIHFDDYFYPYPSYNDEQDFPDDNTWNAYKESGGKLSRGDWRRKAVNDFVEDLHELIRDKKPHVKLGISPFGIYRPGHPHYIKGFDQYEKLYADAHLWLKEGWVDYMTPQLYWEIRNPDQSFAGLLTWWNDNNPEGRHIWPGLYTSRLLGDSQRFDDEEIPMQITWTKAVTKPSSGHVHFSIKALQQDARGVATKLKEAHYAQAALVPASPWMSQGQPDKPAFSAERRHNDTVHVELDGDAPGLTWVVQVGIDGRWAYKVVPATETSAVVALPEAPKLKDGQDPQNLDKLPITVAVFTVDRAGVASEKATDTLASQWAR